MKNSSLSMVALPDLSGIVRGKSFGPHRKAKALRDGLAWPPANILISPFSTIPGDNPFGPMGEITLRADVSTLVRLPEGPQTPSMDLYLADIHDPSGEPWAACPRTVLKTAIAELKAESGLTMKLAFEHEFIFLGEPYGRDPSFSLAAIRRAGALADEVDRLSRDAAMPLEQIVPEYGDAQYEIASSPKDPLRACDEAVLSREIIRDVARRAGIHATFVPKLAQKGPGNGIHAHFSLWRGKTPALAANGWLTDKAAAFAAGILAHAEALLLFTTGSTISYLRIRPHSWVGAYTCMGTRNREAMIRFCPRSDAGRGPLPKASLELRVLDGTANVYLAIAAMIRAGLDGIRRSLPPPTDIHGDPDAADETERAAKNVRALPATLEAVLAAADRDQGFLRQFPELLIKALLSVRRDDVRRATDTDAETLASRLSRIY